MALKDKPKETADLARPPVETPPARPENNGTRPAPRVNEEIDKQLNTYIEANKETFERYTKLVQENPERAARTLMLKDMQSHKAAQRLVEKQLPAAVEWYDKQKPEVKKSIDERVAKASPFDRDQEFVRAVVRERNWQNRLPLAPSQRMGAGARV